jgi:hypothetical protein
MDPERPRSSLQRIVDTRPRGACRPRRSCPSSPVLFLGETTNVLPAEKVGLERAGFPSGVTVRIPCK